MNKKEIKQIDDIDELKNLISSRKIMPEEVARALVSMYRKDEIKTIVLGLVSAYEDIDPWTITSRQREKLGSY